jgi:hypothetical protein
MPYVQRAGDGAIASLHRTAEGAEREYLDDNHPEVQAFVGRAGAGAYERLDAEFIRVLEDLIDALLDRGVINVTDLPAEAQHKLLARKGHRSALGRLNLLGDRSDVDGGHAPEFERYA